MHSSPCPIEFTPLMQYTIQWLRVDYGANTRGCAWSTFKAIQEAVLTQQGCDTLAETFLPSSRDYIHIRALRRGIHCPRMLKTTFNFLGTLKPLFLKVPYTQFSSFFFLTGFFFSTDSTTELTALYKAEFVNFENGDILEVFS